MTGMISWVTTASTILLNAPPMMTPAARSMMLPRMRNCPSSLNIREVWLVMNSFGRKNGVCFLIEAVNFATNH